MKNIMLTLTWLFFTTIIAFGQSKYESSMQKAFELWEDGNTQQASALFERISQAEKDNWIPLYHAANVLISSSFAVEDPVQRNNMLEKAKSFIAEAHNRSADNSELLTLEGLLYTAYVTMDPQTYGMTHSPKIMELHEKAIQLDPENPRAHLNKIQYAMGTAQFFGQDITPLCEQMKEIIPKFENRITETLFAPSWGVENAKQIVTNCNE